MAGRELLVNGSSGCSPAKFGCSDGSLTRRTARPGDEKPQASMRRPLHDVSVVTRDGPGLRAAHLISLRHCEMVEFGCLYGRSGDPWWTNAAPDRGKPFLNTACIYNGADRSLRGRRIRRRRKVL